VAEQDALTAELASFVEAARTGQAPKVDGAQAVAALEIAEQVLASVATHRWDGAAAGRTGPHAHAVHDQRRAA
jgi:predicted dehydrogenase